MNKADALDAAPIVERCMANLLTTIQVMGRTGSDARQQISDTKTNAYALLRADTIGPELDASFDQARLAGASFMAVEALRQETAQELPTTLGGTLIQNSLLQFCLATEGAIIADMTFTSRQDVDKIKGQVQQPFLDSEEQAADDMDQMVFQALIALHGAIVTHLVQTERPLPLMLNYQFAAPSNTLVVAYRLYSDASRADQVRDENKIIHPAFAPSIGQALSS
jgi:prophage DNA circulation protein